MSNLYIGFREDIYKFFFRPVNSFNLGISRFLYCGIIFFLYIGTDFSQWGKVPEVLWHPIFFFDFFSIPVLAPEILGILGKIWIISIFFCSVGFLTRLNTLLVFLIGLYLLGLVNSFAKTHHTETLMLLIFGIMSFSKCGDSFSIDNLWKNYRLSDFHGNNKESVEYSWPISLVRVMFVFMFCAAGLSKFRNSGFEWVTSDYLSSLFISSGFRGSRTDPIIGWLPFWLGSHNKLCHFLAGSAFFLEIFSPLALLNKYLRVVIIPSLFLLVSGFWIILGIPFPQLLASFVFWIPWNRIIKFDKKAI